MGKDSDRTKTIGLCLCYFKSDRSPLDSAGVWWTPVDSGQNKGGRVKSSTIIKSVWVGLLYWATIAKIYQFG